MGSVNSPIIGLGDYGYNYLGIPTFNLDFKFDIKVVQRFDKAEINQELFDKAFGEGVIKSEEEFTAKMTEEIKSNFVRETDYRFMIDAKNKFVEKMMR